jgi:hypothetical protein
MHGRAVASCRQGGVKVRPEIGQSSAEPVRRERNRTATRNSQRSGFHTLLGPISGDEIQFSRLVSLAPDGNAGHSVPKAKMGQVEPTTLRFAARSTALAKSPSSRPSPRKSRECGLVRCSRGRAGQKSLTPALSGTERGREFDADRFVAREPARRPSPQPSPGGRGGGTLLHLNTRRRRRRILTHRPVVTRRNS